jgi:hypothetical protein
MVFVKQSSLAGMIRTSCGFVIFIAHSASTATVVVLWGHW